MLLKTRVFIILKSRFSVYLNKPVLTKFSNVRNSVIIIGFSGHFSVKLYCLHPDITLHAYYELRL